MHGYELDGTSFSQFEIVSFVRCVHISPSRTCVAVSKRADP